mmetsp:Transcript_7565/g.8793  ORF Transcript_7565/g.8793 Transcript_7565/m.8793 type:complete len:96 (+) Transcript_7565:277-564(+)
MGWFFPCVIHNKPTVRDFKNGLAFESDDGSIKTYITVFGLATCVFQSRFGKSFVCRNFFEISFAEVIIANNNYTHVETNNTYPSNEEIRKNLQRF